MIVVVVLSSCCFLSLMLVLVVRVKLGIDVGGVDVDVWLHIPHLVNGPSCSKVQTWQVEESSLGEGKGEIPSPPTSIGQDPADMDGEVFGGEDGEGRGVPLKRRRGSL